PWRARGGRRLRPPPERLRCRVRNAAPQEPTPVPRLPRTYGPRPHEMQVKPATPTAALVGQALGPPEAPEPAAGGAGGTHAEREPGAAQPGPPGQPGLPGQSSPLELLPRLAQQSSNMTPWRETALQQPCCGGYVFIPCRCDKLCVKEDDGERARALPLGERVPGLLGRDLPRHRPTISAHRRQPRGPAASPEAHRGQGRRRAAPHDGRRLEGSSALRDQRRSRPRAARPLLGKLIASALFLAAAVPLGGCDQGVQRDERPGVGLPSVPLRLLAANIDMNHPLPSNGRIELQFDRLLQPLSVIRQTFVLEDIGMTTAFTPPIAYDPVARIVTITPLTDVNQVLKPDQTYELIITTPKDRADVNGLRAIDGALLEAPSFRTIAFKVTDPLPSPPTTVSIDFCRDIYPIFSQKCSLSPCHLGPSANDKTTPMTAAGLALDPPSFIAGTAPGRVAQGANTGARSVAAAPSLLFGEDMPII